MGARRTKTQKKRTRDGPYHPRELGRGSFRIYQNNANGPLLALVQSGDSFLSVAGTELWAFTQNYNPPQNTPSQTWYVQRAYTTPRTDFHAWAAQEASNHQTTISRHHIATWIWAASTRLADTDRSARRPGDRGGEPR
jgi:hypothetical protein